MASAGSAIPGSADVGDRQAELGCAARLCRPAGQPAVRPQVVEPLRFYACRDRGAQIPARGGPASGCGRSIQDSEFGRRPRKADRDRLQGPSPELHRPPADVTLRLASRTKMCARDAGAEPSPGTSWPPWTRWRPAEHSLNAATFYFRPPVAATARTARDGWCGERPGSHGDSAGAWRRGRDKVSFR